MATITPTPATTCDDMKALDVIFDTDPASPLHHDNRCTAHRVTAPVVMTPCYCDSAYHPAGHPAA